MLHSMGLFGTTINDVPYGNTTTLVVVELNSQPNLSDSRPRNTQIDLFQFASKFPRVGLWKQVIPTVASNAIMELAIPILPANKWPRRNYFSEWDRSISGRSNPQPFATT